MISNKSRGVAFLLAFFLGAFGAHRFYVGKPLTGALYMFTLGLVGVGVLVDIVMLLAGVFKDGDGGILAEW